MYIEIVSADGKRAVGSRATQMRRRLPPDPERFNRQRSDHAMVALKAFMAAGDDDPTSVVSDLLTNLMHLCDRHPEYGIYAKEAERAEVSYLEETAQVGMYEEVIEIR